ncbi:MAG TPA: MFS transporter [Acidobacteriaceae bacterium]|jgi:MFS family permease|nr:MFS transporter [Acidobacteriaceae bacterium]
MTAPSTTVRAAETRLSYPGWRVAAVCHIGVLTGFATVFIYSFSFMVQPLQHAFGWDREQIAQAFSLAAISVAIGSPFIGKLFDRYDPRKLIAGFMAAFGLGIAGLAFLTPHLTQLYINAVFIGITGTGTYQLGYARVIAGWFERKLGAALSIVVAGSGVGSFVVPPLVQHLIATYGWREAYLVLAALPLLMGAPLTLLFARSSPSAQKSASVVASDAVAGLTWPQALGTMSFWLLALGVCALSLTENGALAHLAPMLSDHGLAPRQVAFTASLLGVSSLAGRFALGWLLDYLKGSHIAIASLLVAAIGMFLLAHARAFASAAPAALLAGLGGGCELDLIPYMLRRYFGLRSFSTLYGLVYSAYAVAGATAPLVLGHYYDVTGSYSGLFNVFCGVTLVAAFAMFALPAYRYTAFAAAPDADGLLAEPVLTGQDS